MDGENNGSKTLFFNGWLGGTIIFGNIHSFIGGHFDLIFPIETVDFPLLC